MKKETMNLKADEASRVAKPLVTALAAVMLVCAVPQTTKAAASGAVTPYTFLGRVMDARHAAFDTNRVCRLSAYGASGDLLSETTTFFRADSARNYALKVPVSTSDATGFAVQGERLVITAIDNAKMTWSGVIPESVCGGAGAVREVDIVLGEDSNNDGIDDTLYSELYEEWEASEYWMPDEEFDPRKDYDGDGVSTLDEAFSGTDPFNPDDVLRITAFSKSPENETAPSGVVSISFDGMGGRAYLVEESESLDPDRASFTEREFRVGNSTETTSVVSLPSTTPVTPLTIYLIPNSTTNGFYRIKAK